MHPLPLKGKRGRIEIGIADNCNMRIFAGWFLFVASIAA
jgi:hypothetical protein